MALRCALHLGEAGRIRSAKKLFSQIFVYSLRFAY
jgi:hypothetical protein